MSPGTDSAPLPPTKASKAPPNPAGRPAATEKADKQDLKDFRLSSAEMTEFFVDIFELMAEAVGQEWELPAAKAGRMGKRWATLANRWIGSVEGKAIAQVVIRVTLVMSVGELLAVFVARSLKTVKRVRKQREIDAAKNADPLHSVDDEDLDT